LHNLCLLGHVPVVVTMELKKQGRRQRVACL
jgi:hypothetical protein